MKDFWRKRGKGTGVGKAEEEGGCINLDDTSGWQKLELANGMGSRGQEEPEEAAPWQEICLEAGQEELELISLSEPEDEPGMFFASQGEEEYEPLPVCEEEEGPGPVSVSQEEEGFELISLSQEGEGEEELELVSVSQEGEEEFELISLSQEGEEEFELISLSQEGEEEFELISLSQEGEEELELVSVSQEGEEEFELISLSQEGEEELELISLSQEGEEELELVSLSQEGEEELELVSLSQEGEEELELVSVSQEEEEEPKPRRARRKAGFFAQRSVADMVVAGCGLLVLALALLTGGVILVKRGQTQQIEALAPVGQQLETVGILGQDALLAVADAAKGRQQAAKIEEELMKEYQEEELSSEIQVVMKLTSVQKDLKIKFVNEKSGKLIGNVPFVVEINDAEGRTYQEKDEDMDGIIYLTDLTAGDYQVAMAELGEDYSGYFFSTAAESIKVKETIDYEEIDVTDEIKSESEVNVAQEDTAQGLETEGALTDTVEWVESTKTEISSGYTAVDKSSVAAPSTQARLILSETVYRVMDILLSQGTSPEETTTESSSAESSSAETQAASAPAEETTETSVTSAETSEGTSTDTSAETSTEPSAETSTEPSAETSTETEPSTEAAAVSVTGITLSPASASLTAGNTVTLATTVSPSNATDPTVAFTSSNTGVATVDSYGKVTAVQAGTATITAAAGGKTATCSVTVTAAYDPTTDTSTALVATDGSALYVLVNGSYVEAKAADYYQYDTFYKKTGSAEYKYTGWQNLDGYTYYFDKDGNKVTGTQVIQGAQYTFNSDGTLNTGSGVWGIDVSTWNGSIDWTAVKNAGVNYVIIRTGFRGSTVGSLIEDAKFKTNIQGAINAGIKVGVYFFTQAVNEVEAVEEASMVLSQIKGYKITYPVFIDVEGSGGRADSLDAATRTKVINAFCQTIQNGGYTAGIYASKSWLEGRMNISSLSGYKIWLAQYNSQVTYAGRYDMWQYSSQGSVAGISGYVDMNKSFLTY